jgi:hypothetical protein
LRFALIYQTHARDKFTAPLMHMGDGQTDTGARHAVSAARGTPSATSMGGKIVRTIGIVRARFKRTSATMSAGWFSSSEWQQRLLE